METDALAQRVEELAQFVTEARACRICLDNPLTTPLPHEPRPVFRISATARLVIAGQAPGTRVHASGTPFTDPSGDRLRQWMGIDRDVFYDESRIAIVPMGFCFPGLDAKGGDIPPRKECRLHWHERLFGLMPQVETIILLGQYAQQWHMARAGLAVKKGAGLTQQVMNWHELYDKKPRLLPVPHPSWRNNDWLKRNPWFESDLLPVLRAEVSRLCL